ncbi:hypothetical protein U9M48_000415 [Paspalum notatum var. saurae]|uniref:Uncharacterized protein n=1 Tax=Paspalum notatum var. saurae TaxID=547442 RepID=A0AAQ3PK76_PASNO
MPTTLGWQRSSPPSSPPLPSPWPTSGPASSPCSGAGTRARAPCDTGLYNTVIISFFSVFGQHGRYWLDLSGHPLAGVGADIKHCQQSKGGIPVFLSIGGGGRSNNYSISSSASAEAVAIHLCNTFLGGGGSSSNYYAELARRLDHFNSMYYHATKKHAALDTGLFERIHVRFYGDGGGEDDRCSYRKGGTAGVVEQWEKCVGAAQETNTLTTHLNTTHQL